MKRILSLMLVACLLVCSFAFETSAAASEFLIFDSESIKGCQDDSAGNGYPGDVDYYDFTQGEASVNYYTATTEKLIFYYTYGGAHDGATFSLSGYDYVEGDVFALQEMTAKASFRFVANNDHVGGTDWYGDNEYVYFPEREWVHFKLPISEFIDIVSDSTSPTRTEVYRIVFWLEDIGDLYGETIENASFNIDNIRLTKGTDTINTMVTYDEWQELQDNSSVVEPPVSSELPPVSSELPPVSSELPPVSSEEPPVSSEEPVEVTYGDLNHDGNVTSNDALICLQYSVNKLSLSYEELLAANVDGKEPVGSSSDALMILQFAVKKIGSFPVESK